VHYAGQSATLPELIGLAHNLILLMPYITGSRLKAERAGKHLAELEERAARFIQETPYGPSRRLDADNYAYFIYEFPPQPTPSHELGVILGDLAHNLRSALDHIAWQLALLTTSNPSTQTAFPIFAATDKEKMSKFRIMTKDVLDEARPIMEALQPYHWGTSARANNLWILHSLWNTDKHRMLNPVPVRLRFPQFTGLGGHVHHFGDGRIEVRVPRGANPEKELEPHITREVLFEIPHLDDAAHVVGPEDRVGLEVLRAIHHTVRDEIVPLFTRYLPEVGQVVERKAWVSPRT
jgi:hypothetical protein